MESKMNTNGPISPNQYREAIGRRAVQNNPSCSSTNLMNTSSQENFSEIGQHVLDSIDVRGREGAQELRMQIRAARQFAIAHGKG